MRVVRVSMFALALSAMALAADFSGTLLDESCYSRQKQTKGCEATASTSSFALAASGTVYKLDEAGNAKAVAALKDRADRAKDPSKAVTGPVMAKISGTASGGSLQVDSIEVQ